MARKKSIPPPAAEPTEKHAGGRPTDYCPIYCEMLVKHMEDGLSYESFAGVVDCCEQTLFNWEKQFPEFMESKNKGKPKSRLFWEKAGRDGLHNETIKDGDGMTVTKSVNSTIWIFNMKNRFGWRDKQKDEDDESSKRLPGVQLTSAQLVDVVKKARNGK